MKKNKYIQGTFHPKNKEKYVGKELPIYRSSLECTIMNFFDSNKHIIAWSSESIQIPYADPISKRWRTYYPDFMIKYVKHNKEYVELIEVKPQSQTAMCFAKSKRDKEAVILNEAKWKYATAWCNKNHIKFRIITEKDIYL